MPKVEWLRTCVFFSREERTLVSCHVVCSASTPWTDSSSKEATETHDISDGQENCKRSANIDCEGFPSISPFLRGAGLSSLWKDAVRETTGNSRKIRLSGDSADGCVDPTSEYHLKGTEDICRASCSIASGAQIAVPHASLPACLLPMQHYGDFHSNGKTLKFVSVATEGFILQWVSTVISESHTREKLYTAPIDTRNSQSEKKLQRQSASIGKAAVEQKQLFRDKHSQNMGIIQSKTLSITTNSRRDKRTTEETFSSSEQDPVFHE